MGFASDTYQRAWNAHDTETLVSLMTDDVVYEDVSLGEKHQGKAAVRDFIERMESEFSSDYRFEWVSLMETAEGYAAEWVLVATHDGSTPEMPATGKAVRIRGISVGRFRNGLVCENRDYWNMVEFLVQAGLMPAPQAAAAG